jgi:hypothetical protein
MVSFCLYERLFRWHTYVSTMWRYVVSVVDGEEILCVIGAVSVVGT